MTLSEFKAWLDGYEASFGEGNGGAPSREQWAAIKAKLARVQNAPQPTGPRNPALDSIWPSVRYDWNTAGEAGSA